MGKDFFKVSVCMPTYNYAPFLPGAIESVLNQSMEDFEFIVIDDCSRDNSREIVESYARQNPRLAFRINVHNVGLVANWNLCLRAARGTYIKFLFADDLLASREALEKMASMLDSEKGVSLVGSARNVIDSDGNRLKTISHFKGCVIKDGRSLINRCLREWKNLIGEPSTVMFRRSDALRGFNGTYRHLVDLEMWFHLLEKGDFAFLDDALSSFRVHPRQQTARNIGDLADLDDAFLLLEDYLEKPYVGMRSLTKRYMYYDKVYQYWKLYKRGRISKQEAVRRIAGRIALMEYAFLFPLYKTYKPLFKLMTRLRYRGDDAQR
ncbi:MAG: glycosyltransferase [Deltaproteobacteria bacterium]|nr:glycosyltransferase [Deltaproteobacteria bacterium]